MTPEPAWRRYTRFWGHRVDADVDDELAFHVEMRAHDYRRRGLDDRAAHTAALARLGDMGDTRAACLTIGRRRQRRMTRTYLVDAFAQDLRYALRTLSRQIGWTTVAVLTLGIGIGATTAVFSVVNSLILHPLAYRDADRVMMVWRKDAKRGMTMSKADEVADAWSGSGHAVEALEPYHKRTWTLTGRGDAAKVEVGAIRPSFLDFAGVVPVVGRGFLPEEGRLGAAPVVLIGEALWRTRFGASRDVLGQRLVLNDRSFTIVGVTPARLRLPDLSMPKTEVWVPLTDSVKFGRSVVARLRPGVKNEIAAVELDTLVSRAIADTTNSARAAQTQLIQAGDLLRFKSSLFLLSGAVLLLLIVACANVAHLLVARGATRERELAIRVALGAGRARLTRQLLTESSVLATLGGVAGVVIGYASIRGLIALRPDSLLAVDGTRLDGRTFLLALAVAIGTGLLLGLTAALHAIRHSTSDSLRATASSGTSARRTHRLRSFLVVTEMALSAMLLVGAALVVRSVVKLRNVDPGFEVRHLYSASIELPRSRYATGPQRAAFSEALIHRARLIPGVIGVTTAGGLPPEAGGFMLSEIKPDGQAPKEKSDFFAFNSVASDYFSVLRIPIVAGTTFDETSAKRSDVIINQGLAKKLWPGEGAVGRRVRFGDDAKEPWRTVVGVVGDVPTRGLSEDRDEPLIYFPLEQKSWEASTLAIRMSGDANPVVPLRAIVAQLDKGVVPPAVRSAADGLADSIASHRFTMTLLAAFATLAVLLSAIGLYGVIAYVVTQRQREIGIRIALGATPRHVARAIVVRALALSTIGLVIGLGVATWGSKLIRASLYEVSATDPAAYVGAGVLLLAVSALACLIPMRRAMSVDPAIAMRGD